MWRFNRIASCKSQTFTRLHDVGEDMKEIYDGRDYMGGGGKLGQSDGMVNCCWKGGGVGGRLNYCLHSAFFYGRLSENYSAMCGRLSDYCQMVSGRVDTSCTAVDLSVGRERIGGLVYCLQTTGCCLLDMAACLRGH